MKMMKIALLLLIYVVAGFAQVHTDPLNGNVGIGITDPAAKLDVNGSLITRGILRTSISDANIGGTIEIQNLAKTENGTATMWRIYNMSGAYGNSLQFWAYDNLSCNGGLCNSRLTLLDNGNMGIGTSTPGYKLEVNGDVALPHTGKILSSSDGGNHITLHNGNGLMKLATGGQDRMVIEYTGNVGIGTSVPTEKLSVKGKVRAQEVKVEASNWPDYVFEKGYQLSSLAEIEKQINFNGHLPGMPSAKEAEENGIELGVMNNLLLKKVEELTLHLIKKDKEIDALKKMEKRLAALERTISKKK